MNNAALPYWALMAIGCTLAGLIARKSYRQRQIALMLLMIWNLVQGAISIASLFLQDATYARIYFLAVYPGCLLMALVAIGLGSDLVPRWKQRIFNYGPIVIVVPAFLFTAVILPIMHLKYMGIEEITVICAGVLLAFCIGLEHINALPGAAKMAWCYLAFLALTFTADFIWEKFGITPVTRSAPQIAYILGSGFLLWGLKK